jgi:hypothetical protein
MSLSEAKSFCLPRSEAERVAAAEGFPRLPQFPQGLSVFLFIRRSYQRAGKFRQVNDLRGFRSGSLTLRSGSLTAGSG